MKYKIEFKGTDLCDGEGQLYVSCIYQDRKKVVFDCHEFMEKFYQAKEQQNQNEDAREENI